MPHKIAIGLDFGSDSVRALAVDCQNGEELAASITYYPRWKKGLFCNPILNQFRQHPLDFMESLTEVVCSVVKQLGGVAKNIVAIGVDATGSSPAPLDRHGQILALRPDFSENPNAMFILWKDHTAIEEAEEINRLCQKPAYSVFLKGCGGVYSSEWFWSKILHSYRNDEAVKKATVSWVECSDWIPALLTGTTLPHIIKRNRCAAGHKCLWNEQWGGLPSYEFFKDLDPVLVEELPYPLFKETYTADMAVGKLTKEWTEKLGLNENVTVSGGAIDSHVGAIGAGVKPYSLVKVIGTSTCDMLTAESEQVKGRFIKGICGQVNGSIVPGYIGFEAGQSAFGDIFAWFQRFLGWPLQFYARNNFIHLQEFYEIEHDLLNNLAEEWYKNKNLEYLPIAVDWFNGRRTPYANQRLKGTITGLTLATDAVAVFGSLIVSTACGARAIMECFVEQDIPINTIIAIGGIAKKSSVIMQTCADIMKREIKVSDSEQCCALGGAILGAVAAKVYSSVLEAQHHMSSPISKIYKPDLHLSEQYERIYGQYQQWARVSERQYV